ncbi:hypothetical protein AVEN_186952-1 [Araneus ventricosus]|uniref:Uncharacterized protein n=1 Tax=Araneus ventricosus TaxID=182803 RepID=A0A4Y2UXF9_ARAVE|nr:hypothetical protein AVEN_18485-1 [Araneus ventricosus]GBO17708.1 hypothetical protein AVEN_80576-1 [Araneus ventricosus]GBO17716.1 hypothetical protein AVEN_23395-1 [Araneus ventricosus]GBO17719.1 hypothetical protein AVEN_186952-1 [Araneus ventricosus]
MLIDWDRLGARTSLEFYPLCSIKNESLILHQGLKNVAGTSWGLSKNNRRQLYLTVVEKVILYASAARTHNITARQHKLLSSIQRKFLLNITGAHNTTPTAALQVIEGLMPLHIKAKMQSTLVRVGRLGRNCEVSTLTMKAMSSHQHHQQYTLHFLAWKIESHLGDKVLPIERQMKYIQMAQR